MMNELRWILIVCGIALLAGIYAWGRRKAQPEDEPAAVRAAHEPQLGSRAAVSEPRYEPAQYSPSEYTDDAAYAEDDYEPEPVHDEAPEDDWLDRQEQPITAGRHVHSHSHAHAHAPVTRESRSDASDDPRLDAPASHAIADDLPDYRRARREPTLGEQPASASPQPRAATPQREPAPAAKEAPAARRSERRKILALRLSLAPQGVEGGRLLEVFQEELLEHGRYNVFHRLHDDGEALFSIASMIEPGTFDPEQMDEVVYPGVMLFTQLPGPVAGMHSLNEMVSCARRLQHGLGGVLQDDRGVTLTEHRVERMREEVREFERPPGAR